MVMEASPSPQSVGREFVRQYYTLLNKAPAHLHRFYNNYSSFVHGGLDAPNRETLPVVGQKQIHNRIQQLNFRDCHAKISQVDAQATLGNGVVVQVTGELSNGGAPMRRFTQTFVLAAQAPKQYYVHNDIFRYQDIVVSDEEGSGGARSEGSEDEAGFLPPAPPAYRREPPPHAAAPPPHAAAPPHAPAPPHAAPPPHAAAVPPHAPLHLNGHPPVSAQSIPSGGVGGVGGAAGGAGSGAVAAPPERSPEPEPAPSPPPHDALDASDAPHHMQAASPAPAPAPAEPKTYANLVKSGGGPAPRAEPQAAPPAPQAAPPAASRRHAAPPGGGGGGGATGGGAGGGGASGGAGGGESGARRYSDAQQVFLGNVPAHASEEQLRALFARFGAVLELRLHTKGGAHPNYGFVTFESAGAASACLHAAPLYFGSDAVKLNVEEKKRRVAPRPRHLRR